MKILRVKIIEAETCGGLLDGLELYLRDHNDDSQFDPICLVGPNGAGKSQFLQILVEIFHSIFREVCPDQERKDGNNKLTFEIEYLIHSNKKTEAPHRVRVSRLPGKRKKSNMSMRLWKDDDWAEVDLTSDKAKSLLPSKVVGYTSGENETLSLPFLLSRSGYAEDVRNAALKKNTSKTEILDTRLMLIDYGTHLEVLLANLLLGTEEQRDALLEDSRSSDLCSFRIVIQLNHSSVTKEVQLTKELESYIDWLKSSSTCYDFDEKDKIYKFDFWVDAELRKAFGSFWKDALELYNSFHKISMLNDLALKKSTRDSIKKNVESRRFATRLPEPPDDDKIFRFERVQFSAKNKDKIVDYISLSDGEHQLAQLLGTFSMIDERNVLFLLDEPESHFNPQWRVKFCSKLKELPSRASAKSAEQPRLQECLLTTHAPFVPSDMRRENVVIFSKPENKVETSRPNIETFGSTFDLILEECFMVKPPISGLSRDAIKKLEKSNDPDEIEEGMKTLGPSAEKLFLADRLRQLRKESK